MGSDAGRAQFRTPAAPHRCCPPQHVPLRRRSVYGLVSGTVLPGRLPTPKRSGIVTRLLLTYRCGGSAGLAFVGFTGFPFHSCDHEVDERLNAASVCRPSSAASTAFQSAAMPPGDSPPWEAARAGPDRFLEQIAISSRIHRNLSPEIFASAIPAAIRSSTVCTASPRPLTDQAGRSCSDPMIQSLGCVCMRLTKAFPFLTRLVHSALL